MAAFVGDYYNSTMSDAGNHLGYHYGVDVTGYGVHVKRYKIVRSSDIDTSGPTLNYPSYRHISRAEAKVQEQRNAPRPKPTRRTFKEPAHYSCLRREFQEQYRNWTTRFASTQRGRPSPKYTTKRRTGMGTSYRQKRRNYVVKLRKGL